MENGFQIGRKTFIFLHHSNSQVRAHSWWFFWKEELKYDVIFESLGDFSIEKKISKNAARRGQAFSSTTKVTTLSLEKEVEHISDLTNGNFIFSDGCGEIWPQLANEIALKYGVRQWSAFQIRMGGYKGVLMVSDNFEGDAKVKVRPSMKKFNVNSKDKNVDLEIIRMATYSPGYLNKQIISILWANGVDDHVFLEMQKDTVKWIREDYDISNLKNNPKCLSSLSTSVNLIGDNIRKAHSQNLKLENDPFVLLLIKLANFNKLREIREKFRIYDENCWVLIGVIDSFNWLEEGEVFVQFWKFIPPVHSIRIDVKKELKEGKVIVGRNPCVHPGDIRVLKAVNRPELKEYLNVIVFSSKGSRPEQTKMASGDLDGDTYWINWRPEFVNNFAEQPPWAKVGHEPQPEKPYYQSEGQSSDTESESENDKIPLNKKIFKKGLTKTNFKRKDFIKNYFNWLKNDYLGLIANLHSKISDAGRDKI